MAPLLVKTPSERNFEAEQKSGTVIALSELQVTDLNKSVTNGV